jgi:hypothetical protein
MGASDDAIVVGMSAASARSVRPHLVRIDSRLGTIDGRIETMDGRFVAIEGPLDTADGRLVAIEEHLDTNDVRFDRVVVQEEFDRRVATLVSREEWKRGDLKIVSRCVVTF